MSTVLHVAPHLGGGAGTVITALVDAIALSDVWRQEIVCFEKIKGYAKNWASVTSIAVNDSVPVDSDLLCAKIAEADIVHVHYWNHPATSLFMHTFSGSSMRTVFWSHPNGCHVPYQFNNAILDFPDIFCIASDYSERSSCIVAKDDDWRRRHLRKVFSCAGTNGFEQVEPREHAGFCVGYVGTVDYCKMHRRFIEICNRLNIPGLRVVVCGGDSDREIAREARLSASAVEFDFRGKVDDIAEVLAELDVFIYPLAEKNYGTGEQVVIEAMSAGVPQIVLGDSPESYVVKDSLTGLVASDVDDFIRKVKLLYHDSDYRALLSVQSREYAQQHYTIEHTASGWLDIYRELLKRPKSAKHFQLGGLSKKFGIATGLFLQALGESDERDIYLEALGFFPATPPASTLEKLKGLPPILKSKTRGSVEHYGAFFDDCRLNYLKDISE